MGQDDLQAQSTSQPVAANLRITTGAGPLSDENDRAELGIDLHSAKEAAHNARADMDENLKAYTALYEMEVIETDEPWENAANLVLPMIPAEVDSMLAYIASQVFVQRLVIVTAGDDDPETARLAPQVEKFYNAELRRIRSDSKTPIEHFLTVLHLGLRDGGGPVDVLFNERKERKLILSEGPKVIEDGIAIENGEIATERTMTPIDVTVAEVSIQPYMLKDLYLLPGESTSLHTALGLLKTTWMTEKDLKEKVAAGTFRLEDVEEILANVTAGTTDVASSEGGYEDKDAGGQINVGLGQGALVSKFFANRGPAECERLFSDQFDMNGDGIPERNVFWFYSRYPKFLGFMPYEYVAGEWPTFMFSPFPRPDRPYGYSLVERLADLLADANAGRNQRRNYIDLCIMPLLLQRAGDTVHDKDRAFGPGLPWTVDDVDKSLRWFVPPQIPPDSFQDSADIEKWVAKVTGQNAPALGAQGPGRRSATESRQQHLAQSTRAQLVAMLFRAFLRAVMQFWHKLDKQYLGAATEGPSTMVSGDLAKSYGERGGPMTLPPGVLARNFNIDIAGLSDPIDAPSRRQEFTMAITTVAQLFPWIFSDPEKAYALAEYYFELFQLEGITRFIGTPEEALQRKEEMVQQAAAAAQAAAAGQPQPGANGKTAVPHPHQ